MVEVLSYNDGLLILQPAIDIKMENARDYFLEFREELDREFTEVVIDFSQIKFIDSSGMGCILKTVEIINGRGGKVQITGLSRSLHSVFKLSGLHKVFNILDADEVKLRYPDLAGDE